MISTYDHARHLYDLGMSIIPIRRDTKIPAVKWKHYQAERCTIADLRHWFRVCGFAIGIVTGAVSGIVVVDCDDQDSIDTFLDFCASDGAIEESMVCQNTTRGLHLIYRHPGRDTRNTVRCLGARVDVRGDGGYIRAYEDSQAWTAEKLAQAPTYQPLPRERRGEAVGAACA